MLGASVYQASTGRFAGEPMDAMIRKAAKGYVVAAG